MAKTFFHLHHHSEFSLLDAAGKVKDIVKRANELHIPKLAMTDHGTCGGLYNLHKLATKENIQPIYGCEVYVSPNRLRKGLTDEEKENFTEGYEKKEHKKIINQKEKDLKIRRTNHLVLLAKNDVGITNLFKIVSDANINGFYYRPRTDLQYVFDNKEGLIVLSACLGGNIQDLILNNKIKKAEMLARRMKQEFGDDFYLEIQPNKLSEQIKVNEILLDIAKRNDIKFVASNDCHYILEEDKKAHDNIILLRMKRTWAEVERIEKEASEDESGAQDKRYLYSVDDLYIKTYDQMLESFKKNNHEISDDDIKESLDRSTEIAEKITAKLDFTKPAFPAVKIPEKYDESIKDMLDKYDQTELSAEQRKKEALFKILINEGWEERIIPHIPEEQLEEYEERLKFEYEVITTRGFTEYFLVVAEFIIWAKERNILVGPGRGSCVGSLIAYLMKITDLDPIPLGLYFERFLNPERAKVPDIDTDFQDDKREEVRQHIIDEYGEECVAQIIAYSTMSVNACFRDIARNYSIPLQLADEIARQLIGQHEAYKSYMTIEENLEITPSLNEYFKHPEWGDTIKEAFEILSKIQHQMRHASIAAAASVITQKAIYNYTTIRKTKLGLVIEWDGSMISKTNLLKMDLLGIRCLKIVNETLTMLKKKKIEIDLYDMNIINDKKMLDLFQAGDTLASFQFDSRGMRTLLKNMKPDGFEDIIAAAALYRPGPLSSGLVQVFCDKKNNKYVETKEDKENQKFTKLFDPFLENTYGVIVYQEQLMYIFHKVFGLNLSDSDLLRRAVDQKDPAMIAPYIDKIKNKEVQSQITDEKTLKEALAYIQKISGYSFNRCIHKDSMIYDLTNNRQITIEQAYKEKDKIKETYSIDPSKWAKIIVNEIKDIYKTGKKKLFETKLKSGKIIKTTKEHKFFINNFEEKLLNELKAGDYIATNSYNLDNNLKYEEIESIEYVGEYDTYDIEMESPHNNYIANDIVVHNSHSAGYAFVALWTMYLKAHHPLEFGLSTINNRIEYKHFPVLIKEFINRWKIQCNVDLVSFDINRSKTYFEYYPEENKIYCGLLMLKGIGDKITKKIEDGQHYVNIEDFLSRPKIVNKGHLDILVKVGALDILYEKEFKEPINRHEMWYIAFAFKNRLDTSQYKAGMSEEDFLKLPKLKGKKKTFREVMADVRTLKIEDYDFTDKEKIEKLYLGFNIFYRDLDRYDGYKRKYTKYTGTQIITCSEALEEDVKDGETVLLFVNILEAIKKTSKAGNDYYFIKYEDGTMESGCISWLKTFKNNEAKLKEGSKVLLAVKKSMYMNKPSFLLDNKYEEHSCIMSLRSLSMLFSRNEKEKK